GNETMQATRATMAAPRRKKKTVIAETTNRSHPQSDIANSGPVIAPPRNSVSPSGSTTIHPITAHITHAPACASALRLRVRIRTRPRFNASRPPTKQSAGGSGDDRSNELQFRSDRFPVLIPPVPLEARSDRGHDEPGHLGLLPG